MSIVTGAKNTADTWCPDEDDDDLIMKMKNQNSTVTISPNFAALQINTNFCRKKLPKNNGNKIRKYSKSILTVYINQSGNYVTIENFINKPSGRETRGCHLKPSEKISV